MRDGTSWSILANPPGGKQVFIEAVSCPSPTMCVLAGQHYQPNGTHVPVFEKWNGSALTVVPLPTGFAATVFRPHLHEHDAMRRRRLERRQLRPRAHRNLRRHELDGRRRAEPGQPGSAVRGLVRQSDPVLRARELLRQRHAADADRGAPAPNGGHYSNSLAAVSYSATTTCQAVGFSTHDHVHQTLALSGA
jgi:hypothetical protein